MSETIVIALLVAEARPDEVIRGSGQRTCVICHRTAWVAPTSLRFTDCEINCTGCFLARQDLPEYEFKGLAPGGLEELQNELG